MVRNTYLDLIQQSSPFPRGNFNLCNQHLTFHGISIHQLIEKYGTPFNLIYLPNISTQIQKARHLFANAIQENRYTGQYHYTYCMKCNYFHHVLCKVLNQSVNLETSSAFDVDLILELFRQGKLDNSKVVIHNGYKTDEYILNILKLQKAGFKNAVVVLDSTRELAKLLRHNIQGKIKIGLRMSINEESKSAYHASRLGIPKFDMISFFKEKIQHNIHVDLVMLHFFVDSGIRDSLYYWGEFQKAIELYVELATSCPSLDSFNIGGGFPIPNHLNFEYDYPYMINEIIKNIQAACDNKNVSHPDIHTEFGRYTVGQSSAIIFKVLEQKKQNDTELWYIINNSLMNTIPDAWSIDEKFILLPINKWKADYTRVNIGGISCDRSDYYNAEDFNQEVSLPRFKDDDKEPLYLGFFHTGAYQDSISGYGGIKHCLIPAPKHVIVDQDQNGEPVDYLYRKEQTLSDMLNILGYEK